MRRTIHGAPPRPDAPAPGRVAALITALVLATAGLAGAVEPGASLTADPIEDQVVRGEAQEATFTATLLDDASAEIGCIRVTLPDGWVVTDVTGTMPASGWSSAIDGTVVTWKANNTPAILDTTGDTAVVSITATSPDSPGEAPWNGELFAAKDCSGTALATAIAGIVVTGGGGGGGGGEDDGEGPPEGHPGFAFEGGNGDGEGRHGVIVDVAHTADDNRGEWRIKCVLVTLPDGYTDIEVTGILPESGWMGSVDGMVVRYGAGEGGQPLRLPSPGMEFPREASFLITGTPPEGDGPFEWMAAAFSPEACEDTEMATPLGTATYVYDESDGDGDGDGGGTTTVDTGGTGSEDAEELVPGILAADPPSGLPIPALIPAGEGAAPLTERIGTASVLAGLAAAAAALAALLRRRTARREREEVRAR